MQLPNHSVDYAAYNLTSKLCNKQEGRKADRQTDRQHTNRQTDRLSIASDTYIQTDRQTCRSETDTILQNQTGGGGTPTCSWGDGANDGCS